MEVGVAAVAAAAAAVGAPADAVERRPAAVVAAADAEADASAAAGGIKVAGGASGVDVVGRSRDVLSVVPPSPLPPLPAPPPGPAVAAVAPPAPRPDFLACARGIICGLGDPGPPDADQRRRMAPLSGCGGEALPPLLAAAALAASTPPATVAVLGACSSDCGDGCRCRSAGSGGIVLCVTRSSCLFFEATGSTCRGKLASLERGALFPFFQCFWIASRGLVGLMEGRNTRVLNVYVHRIGVGGEEGARARD